MKKKQKRVIKMGNSLGVTIPAQMLSLFGIQHNDKVILDLEDKYLVIKIPLRRRKKPP